MTKTELFAKLKDAFLYEVEKNSLQKKSIKISAQTLSPIQAIGKTKRKDFPILVGKEIMVQAEYEGAKGQAFTSAPADYCGTIEEIVQLQLNDDYERGLFIASMNAVMCYLGLADHTIHCKDNEPEDCAMQAVPYIKKLYGNPKIGLIGYQPALLEHLSLEFELRILDLNPDNIGHSRYGVVVEDGEKLCDEVKEWADLVLCTGSTLCNGSLVDFIDIDKQVVFYGTTIAATAKILNLSRLCLCST